MTTGTEELTLLGFRKNGQPIYLVRGAADPPQFQPPGADNGEGADSGDPPEDDPGGDDGADPGEGEAPPEVPEPDSKDKRLAEMRAKSRRDRAKYHAEIAELKAQIAKKPAAGDGGTEPDPEQIRKEAQEQARTEVLHERALDKVEIAAAKAGFAEPEDARLFLAANAEEFISGGKVDLDAIADAVTELATKRAYLLKGPKGKRFEGGVGQGPRGTGPKSLDVQIAEARKAGDSGRVIALEMQKLTTAEAK